MTLSCLFSSLSSFSKTRPDSGCNVQTQKKKSEDNKVTVMASRLKIYQSKDLFQNHQFPVVKVLPWSSVSSFSPVVPNLWVRPLQGQQIDLRGPHKTDGRGKKT